MKELPNETKTAMTIAISISERLEKKTSKADRKTKVDLKIGRSFCFVLFCMRSCSFVCGDIAVAEIASER